MIESMNLEVYIKMFSFGSFYLFILFTKDLENYVFIGTVHDSLR